MSDLPRLRFSSCHSSGEAERTRRASGPPAAPYFSGPPAAPCSSEPPRASRRRFLRGASLALGAAGGFTFLPQALATVGPVDVPREGRSFKIALGQWSLHKELQAKRLDPLDFARAANGFGLDAIEYSSQFYPGKAADRAYLAELKRRAAGEGVWSAVFRLDAEVALGAKESKVRRRAVESHEKWLEAAAFLGCHAIVVKAASQGSEDDQANFVADGLRRLCELSDPYGISILVDNHGGLSSKASWLAEVLTAVGHPRAGSLPDFGNFDLGGGQEYDRYTGVRELMPFARGVSARSYDFDGRGDETRINYPLMLKIIADAGYHGYVSITYDGQRLSERAGIERTKSLLERSRAQLLQRAERKA
jgi:L-ribulose-5-phosphate 3-epimerase